MTKETMTLEQIRTRGLDALRRELGPAGMVRFLQQFETGKGDYTLERGEWLNELSLDEIVFCDENIRDTTVEWLRALGHDALSVKDVGLAGADDPEVLDYAVTEKRVLLTFNADFADL
jgi:hypothetical protein